MAQVTSGLLAVLSQPWIYEMSQRILMSDLAFARWVDEWVRVLPGQRVLDIGCGTADILRFLPSVGYVGFDMSERYIAAAKRRWGSRGDFYCGRVEHARMAAFGAFDVVVARGVLHHLDDEEARQLFAFAHAALAPGGRVVTIDGCFVGGQAPLVRWLLEHDRGQNIRSEAGYLALSQTAFLSVRSTVRHDLLRVPYCHCMLECTRDF